MEIPDNCAEEVAGKMLTRNMRPSPLPRAKASGTAAAHFSAICLLVVGLLLFGQSSMCQDPRGSIRGEVRDQTGAVIPGATVRVTELATGISASTTTNNYGRFAVPYLTPSVYRLTVEAPGFKHFVREPVELRVGDTVELEIIMELGAAVQSVEVREETPLLETAHASLGQVIDRRRIVELPRRAGNPLELTLLSPGVVNTTNLRLRGPTAPDALSSISADGTGNKRAEFQIDGVTNTGNDRGDGLPRVAYSPPAAAVREFKIETAPYDASVGHTLGAVVNISTASGTNELHGELYYWARNSAFDAPNFFNNKHGTKKTVYRDNRYGAAAGGPLVLPHIYGGRNRTFWHAAFEGENWGVPSTYTNTVPSSAQRRGDFSQLLAVGSQYQIYDPLTTRAAAGGRFSRQPLAGNLIPASRLDPVGVNLVKIYPEPNIAGTADGRNNHFIAYSTNMWYYSPMVRLDHVFSETHRMFFRAHYGKYQNDNQLDSFHSRATAAIINQIKRGFALDDVLVLRPALVLNFRYGLSNADFLERRASRGTDLSALGFAPNLTRLIDRKFATLPRVSAGGYTAYGRWQNGDGGSTAVTNNFLAAFTALRSAHQLRFGADFRVYRTFKNRFSESTAPVFDFPNTYTRGPLDNSPAAPIGQELASMLLGIPGGYMGYTASSALQDIFLGLYFQEDLKISGRLTLNLGLRCEHETPLTERFDRMVAGFDNHTPNPIDEQARANYAANPIPEIGPAEFKVLGGLTWVRQGAAGRSPFRGEKVNVMPRVGISYALTANTTLRLGYGVFYESIGVSYTEAIQTGFSQMTPIQASLDNGLTYVATNHNPFPNGLLLPLGSTGGLRTNLGQSLRIPNRERKHPYAQRWSFNVQRLLPAAVKLDLSYVGNRGTRIGADRELNATPAEYLSRSPVRDQPTIDYLSASFPNPFYGTDPIYGRNISRAALLRPYPHFGTITLERDSAGYSWYHAVEVRAERRFSRGFTFQFGYMFSKLMEAVDFLNATDPMPYECISALDRPQRLTMSGIWEIPVGSGRRFGRKLPAWVGFFVGGWQLNAVITHQSGQALSFGNIIFQGNVKDIPLPKAKRDVDRWFNTEAGFERDPRKQLAYNLRMFPLRLSGVRGDGQDSWDLSVLKNYSITERLKAQFRAEAYNALNQTNFDNPNTSPTSSAFGRITATAGDARNWQLALRLTF